MKRRLYRRLALALFLACVSVGGVAAQEQPPASPPAQPESSAQQAQPPNPDTAVGQDLSKASERAVHAEEGEGHEENAEFKYSKMVAKLGSFIGIGPHGMYWVSLVINFVLLALFFWMLLRS